MRKIVAAFAVFAALFVMSSTASAQARFGGSLWVSGANVAVGVHVGGPHYRYGGYRYGGYRYGGYRYGGYRVFEPRIIVAPPVVYGPVDPGYYNYGYDYGYNYGDCYYGGCQDYGYAPYAPYNYNFGINYGYFPQRYNYGRRGYGYGDVDYRNYAPVRSPAYYGPHVNYGPRMNYGPAYDPNYYVHHGYNPSLGNYGYGTHPFSYGDPNGYRYVQPQVRPNYVRGIQPNASPRGWRP